MRKEAITREGIQALADAYIGKTIIFESDPLPLGDGDPNKDYYGHKSPPHRPIRLSGKTTVLSYTLLTHEDTEKKKFVLYLYTNSETTFLLRFITNQFEPEGEIFLERTVALKTPLAEDYSHIDILVNLTVVKG